MGKLQKQKKTSHTREPNGLPFPATDHKAARERQDSMTDMKHSQKKYRLGTVSKNILEGLNMFDCANLTHISDVDQNT